MGLSKSCPECQGTNLMTHGGISARGGYGPDLLPGTGGIFTSPKLRAVVCKDCGLLRYFVGHDTLQQVNTDNGWYQLQS